MAQQESDFASILRECLETAAETSWEEFFRLAQPVVASAVVRSLNRWNWNPGGLVDDLIQDTFVRLCGNDYRVLRSFRAGETPALCAYLRTIAASIVADHLNSRSALKHGGAGPAVSLDDPSAGTVAADDTPIREIERNLLLHRVENCLSTQNERDQRIFWLYHRHGFSPEAISMYPGIALGKSGVESILYRLTKVIRDCVKHGRHFQTAGEGLRS